jgi:NMD protein affecting ribosome stability and mRNA decay
MGPKAGKTNGTEACSRCHVEIPLNVKRCPHCGERRIPSNRIAIYVGVAGVLALLFATLIMLHGIRRADFEAAPAYDSYDKPAANSGGPDKPPPLNK